MNHRNERRARALGREHAAAGMPALDLTGDGEAQLMTALGQTSPTTERNAPGRWRLLCAYREAFDRAARERAHAGQ